MLFMFLSLSLLSVIDGLPLQKMHSSNLMHEIMSSKDDHKILLNIIADADPEKLKEIIVLVRGLISVSEEELAGLTSSSGVADSAYDDAVTAHDTAVSTQTTGLTQLATDLALAKAVARSLHEQSNTASQLIHDRSDAAAQSIHDQGVVSLQGVVDVAKIAMDGASEAKNTANGVLAVDTDRLSSEISTLYQVIALIQGVIGINTVAPTMSPTTEAPTMSPTTEAPTMSPTSAQINVNCLSLTGYPYVKSVAILDTHLWSDRDYNIERMPAYLIGAFLFKGPHRLSPGADISITTCGNSMIYISIRGTEPGGWLNSLPSNGWTIVDEGNTGKISVHTGPYVASKRVSGASVVTSLPVTNGNLVHSIFVVQA